MWKKRLLCLILILCAFALAACQQQQEVYPNQPRQETPAEQQVNTAAEQSSQQQDVFGVPNYDDGSYDPASEEGGDEELIYDNTTPAPTVRSDYAGATPVKIDPIDKPTPSPLPKMTFSYATYTASALKLTFEGPANWIVDESATDTYVLLYTDENALDYRPRVEIRVVPVTKNYSRKELDKEVNSALSSIRSDMGFKSFDPSQLATRTFIDGNGSYAAYKGNLDNDTETGVAGRIIINCVNKTLYIMHASYPRGLADTFAEGVYNKIRSTMKIVK